MCRSVCLVAGYLVTETQSELGKRSLKSLFKIHSSYSWSLIWGSQILSVLKNVSCHMLLDLTTNFSYSAWIHGGE